MKAQAAALKKQQEAETLDLNDIFTVIFNFARDQGSHNLPESNGKSLETSVVLEALKINVILNNHRNDP